MSFGFSVPIVAAQVAVINNINATRRLGGVSSPTPPKLTPPDGPSLWERVKELFRAIPPGSVKTKETFK
jgi:hypothetical protein